jgi:hypothetical protein
MNINLYETGDGFIEVSVEKKKYTYNAKLPIRSINYIKHRYVNKRAKAYAPCVDSPLYGVETLEDMRNYINKNGTRETYKALMNLYGLGEYTAESIIHIAMDCQRLSISKTVTDSF